MFHVTTPKKVHFTSLGCPRNLVDTEVMLGVMLQAGYEVAQEMHDADYLVVNTCGFLAESRQEGLDTIRALMEEKKQGAKLLVAGCMVQNHSEEIKGNFPDVDYLLGSGEVASILKVIEAEQEPHRITSARSYLESGEVPRMLSTPSHYAYLKIAEGCRKRCAFCIIPKIKGPLQSKPHERVLKEFRVLLERGVREIILIAQDLGDYGKDLSGKSQLVDLLEEMVKVPGDYWIRLLYLYPDEVTDDLIALIKREERICRYVDMPIQHINDTLLQAMRRKTSKGDICAIIEKLRKNIPQMVIRTSLMVGFPGETAAQFEELKCFVKKSALDNVGVFRFSAEEGASASRLPDQVDEATKQDRYEELMKEQLKIVKRRNRGYLGQTLEVVIDRVHPESELLLMGRHKGQCPEVDGCVIINDVRQAVELGKRYRVEITAVAGYDLVGSVLPQSTPKRKLALLN